MAPLRRKAVERLGKFPSSLANAGGFGLKGIRERAEQLGGTMRYQTAPGSGFTLEVELPA